MALSRNDKIYLAYKSKLTAKQREATSKWTPVQLYAILEVSRLFKMSLFQVQAIVKSKR